MGNALYGQASTLGASASNLHINIEDQVQNFPKYKRELINRLSGKNFTEEVKSHEYKWSGRPNRQLQAKLAIPLNSASATELTVDEPGVFNVDDVFQIGTGVGGAQYVVESVAGGVKVTFRKVVGTQQSSYAGGSDVIVIGGATPQGKNADNMVITPFQDYFNYTSIIEDVVDLSGTEHEAMIRGEQGSGKLIATKQMELVEKLQRQIIAGRRFIDKQRKVTGMGGLKDLIDIYAPSNKIDFGGSATWDNDEDVEAVLDDALDMIAEKNFDKPVMYVTSKFMRKFKRVQADTIQTQPDEKKRGQGVVKTYRSHLYGDIDVVQLQGMGHVMDDNVFFLDETQFGYKAMRNRGWFTTPLAKLGDSFRWQVLGEYTVKLDIPEAAVYLYNLGL